MTIDRLLIICSLIELTFIAICDGPDCFNCFQWVAIALLLIKGVTVLDEYRGTASGAVAPDIDLTSSVDTDNAD